MLYGILVWLKFEIEYGSVFWSKNKNKSRDMLVQPFFLWPYIWRAELYDLVILTVIFLEIVWTAWSRNHKWLLK